MSVIDPLQKLIDCTSHFIGLHICFHDNLHLTNLPLLYKRHAHSACRKSRRDSDLPERVCIEFDVLEVRQSLKNKPDGEVHTCPLGLSEIAIPVGFNNLLAGVLFAGPFWAGEGAAPYADLPVAVDDEWIDQRHTMLLAVRDRVCNHLMANNDLLRPEVSRKHAIITYLNGRIYDNVSVADLASYLSLSCSRTSHVVNQLFDMSLPKLFNSLKLQQAAYLLIESDISVGEISEKFGYTDQNYFSRVFHNKYGLSPMAYRQKKAQ